MLDGHEDSVTDDEHVDRVLKEAVVDHLEEEQAAALRLFDLHSEFLALSHFLDLNPHPLLLGDEHVVELLLLLDSVEVIDDDADEEVDDELAADDHEDDEVGDQEKVGVLFWLQVDASAVDAGVHDLSPSFSCHHFKEREHRIDGVVEVLILVHPPASLG